MPVEIRALRLDDRAIWEELLSAYATFYKTEVPEAGRTAVWDWIFGPEEF